MISAKLQITDLHSLEDYAIKRTEFRKKVLEHKKLRRVNIGDHITLYFESALTIQYQIQEMLRVERIFEAVNVHDSGYRWILNLTMVVTMQ